MCMDCSSSVREVETEYHRQKGPQGRESTSFCVHHVCRGTEAGGGKEAAYVRHHRTLHHTAIGKTGCLHQHSENLALV